MLDFGERLRLRFVSCFSVSIVVVAGCAEGRVGGKRKAESPQAGKSCPIIDGIEVFVLNLAC